MNILEENAVHQKNIDMFGIELSQSQPFKKQAVKITTYSYILFDSVVKKSSFTTRKVTKDTPIWPLNPHQQKATFRSKKSEK